MQSLQQGKGDQNEHRDEDDPGDVDNNDDD